VLVPPLGFESIGWILVRGSSHADTAATMRELGRYLQVVVVPHEDKVPDPAQAVGWHPLLEPSL